VYSQGGGAHLEREWSRPRNGLKTFTSSPVKTRFLVVPRRWEGGGRRRAAAGFASDASRDGLARRHGIAEEGTRESALFMPINDGREKRGWQGEKGRRDADGTLNEVARAKPSLRRSRDDPIVWRELKAARIVIESRDIPCASLGESKRINRAGVKMSKSNRKVLDDPRIGVVGCADACRDAILAKRQPTRASSSPLRKLVAENITGRR